MGNDGRDVWLTNDGNVRPRGAEMSGLDGISPHPLMDRMPTVVQTASDVDLVAAGVDTHFQLGEFLQFARRDWFRYNVDRRRWMICIDGIWQVDVYGVVNGMVKAAMDRLCIIRGSGAFTKKVMVYPFLMNTLSVMESSEAMRVINAQFDEDPWILGTPGGIVDLRTGKMRPAKSSDMIMRTTKVAPAASDDCPIWKRFLKEAVAGQEGLEEYLQKFIGYCLTGDMNKEIMTFLYGKGGNGKGVFLYAISEMMGSYVSASEPEKWMRRMNTEHPDWMARLNGVRLVTISELPSGAWNTAQIKAWTGKETPMVARFMYQSNFEFYPVGKLLFTSNDKPEILSMDDGIIRRMRMIHFKNRPETPDETLKDQLRAELPAILRWALDGIALYLKEGLDMPEAMQETTSEYLEAEDIPKRIVSEWFENGNPDYRLLASDVKGIIAAWLQDAGIERRITNNKFNQTLRAAGGVQTFHGRSKAWGSIRLNETGWENYRKWQQRRGVDRREDDARTGCPGWTDDGRVDE
jgi:P4 family phage/plasmid primase-like protien